MKTLLTAILCFYSFHTIASEIEHTGVSIETLAKSDSSWNEAKLPAYPTEAPEISILKYSIPPHTRLSWHKHPVINAGYLISGELIVTAEDGKLLHMQAGDSIIEMVNEWHYGRNDGDEVAEIVVVYVGTKDLPIAILKSD